VLTSGYYSTHLKPDFLSSLEIDLLLVAATCIHALGLLTQGLQNCRVLKIQKKFVENQPIGTKKIQNLGIFFKKLSG
jgi:hypothetical protein